MVTNQQERHDAIKTAAKIEANADLYGRCPNFKWMVDSTVWLHEEEIHESMRVVGGDLFKGRY